MALSSDVLYAFRGARLDNNLKTLERYRLDTLDKWRVSSERASLTLDNLELQHTALDGELAPTVDGVTEQLQQLEVC